MTWRVAQSLLVLRDQVNSMWLGRSKDSDGTIGNEEHAARTSDHNPWVHDGTMGIVTAMDITHDPAHGFNSYSFADMLLAHKDSRIKYVISNRRIGSGEPGPEAWLWRPYHGANPHDHHVHISVRSDKSYYDDTRPWAIGSISSNSANLAPHYVAPPPTLRKGASGPEVMALQISLNAKGTKLTLDGEFGDATEAAVRAFQKTHGLVEDGVAGPQTRTALG